MKKSLLIAVTFSWICALLALILAVTDLYPNNPLQNYRLLVGIGFLSLSGFFRIYLRKVSSNS